MRVIEPGGTLRLAVPDFDALRAMLETAGFRDVHGNDWRPTVHHDYDDYSQAYFPHMDKENGLLISLNVEAAKDGGAQPA